jgi:hypothetical protein
MRGGCFAGRRGLIRGRFIGTVSDKRRSVYPAVLVSWTQVFMRDDRCMPVVTMRHEIEHAEANRSNLFHDHDLPVVIPLRGIAGL